MIQVVHRKIMEGNTRKLVYVPSSCRSKAWPTKGLMRILAPQQIWVSVLLSISSRQFLAFSSTPFMEEQSVEFGQVRGTEFFQTNTVYYILETCG